MKSFILSLVFVLVSTFAFANESPAFKDVSEIRIETKIVTNQDGLDTCYARICWNISENIRDCTAWYEVPCGRDIDLEFK